MGEHRPKKGGHNFVTIQSLNRSWLGIRHILALVNHTQTNGKLKRFHGEIQRKMYRFGDIHRFVAWWNHIRPHMSLNWDNLEMPAGAFIRKMPPKGTTVVDEQSREVYGVT